MEANMRSVIADILPKLLDAYQTGFELAEMIFPIKPILPVWYVYQSDTYSCYTYQKLDFF